MTNKLLYDFKEEPDSHSPHSLSLHEKNGQDILQKFTFVFHSRKSFRLEQHEDEKMMTGAFIFWLSYHLKGLAKALQMV